MADNEWVGVELLAINGVTFPEPMVSASGARAALRAAVAAERERIRAAVVGIFGQFHPMCAVEDEPTDRMVVSRKAVLAIIEADR